MGRDDALHSEAFHVVMKSGKSVPRWLKRWRLLLSEEALMAYRSWRMMARMIETLSNAGIAST